MGATNVNKHFKRLLDTRFLELQLAVTKAEKNACEDLDTQADALDRANSKSERESAFQRKDMAQEALESVVSARKRLREGTFGKCASCGKDIGAKRLEAIPWARNCVTCQKNTENA